MEGRKIGAKKGKRRKEKWNKMLTPTRTLQQ
jgi:hypothetical protein